MAMKKSSKTGRNKKKCERYRTRKGNITGSKPHGPNTGRTNHSFNRSEALTAATKRLSKHIEKFGSAPMKDADTEKFAKHFPQTNKKSKEE